MSETPPQSRITEVQLQAARNVARMQEVAYERDVAVRDLIESGELTLLGAPGPYTLSMTMDGSRTNLAVTAAGGSLHMLSLPVSPFRRLIKDYFLICESHIEATKWAHTDHLQTLDMARRSIHNEGAELVKSLLDSKASMDFNTARRIFTLMCVLHIA